MLSRVADSLYWMSRYLERAEHTSRLMDVTLNLMLEQTPALAERRWVKLFTSLQLQAMPETAAYAMTEWLTFDSSNSASIVHLITAARENARQVREQISSEMWEQINSLYLQIKSTNLQQIWNAEPHQFFRSVKDGAHLFQGITDSTMNHGEGWHFIQIGRYIERATATAALLDAHLSEYFYPPSQNEGTSDYLDFVGILKSCTAFEAYCKVYLADLDARRIAEFLLLNAESPRSIRFAADMIQAGLNAVAEFTQTHKSARANRFAGRLRASLSFGNIEEIMESGLRPYLRDIQQQSSQIHEAIYKTYVNYQIEAALSS